MKLEILDGIRQRENGVRSSVNFCLYCCKLRGRVYINKTPNNPQ